MRGSRPWSSLSKGLLPILVATGALACAAPESVPAKGAIAEEVRAALDSGRSSFDHAEWGLLLSEGTRGGLVDYRYFQAHRTELDAYLARVAAAGIPALAPGHLEALLVNAYNALTVRSILDHPDVDSIREIDGVWDKVTHKVGGHEVTLDQIEHNLLRPFFKDPRIHFVVNCASMSCAPLAPFAYEGGRISDQLDAAARTFLTDARQVRVEGNTLYLSRYFDWYGQDFTAGGWEPRADTLAAFVERYAAPEVAEFIRAARGGPKIAFLDYDWSLNSVRPEGG